MNSRAYLRAALRSPVIPLHLLVFSLKMASVIVWTQAKLARLLQQTLMARNSRLIKETWIPADSGEFRVRRICPFDASSLKVGQRVEVESINAVPTAGGTVIADKVKLQQQSLNGMVAKLYCWLRWCTPRSTSAPTHT